MSIPVSEIKQPFEVVLDNFYRCPSCDGAFRTATLRVDQPCPLCGGPTGYLRQFFAEGAIHTALAATQSYYHREPAGFEIYGKDESKATVVIMFCVVVEALFSQLMRSVLRRQGKNHDEIVRFVSKPRSWPRKLDWFADETGVAWPVLVQALAVPEPLVPKTQERIRALTGIRNEYVHAKKAWVPEGAADEAMELLYPALYFFAAAHNHLLSLGPPDALAGS